jgi:hypothetical protein
VPWLDSIMADVAQVPLSSSRFKTEFPFPLTPLFISQEAGLSTGSDVLSMGDNGGVCVTAPASFFVLPQFFEQV